MFRYFTICHRKRQSRNLLHFRKPKIYFCSQESSTGVYSEPNYFPTYVTKSSFNIIRLYTHRFFTWSLIFRLPDQTSILGSRVMPLIHRDSGTQKQHYWLWTHKYFQQICPHTGDVDLPKASNRPALCTGTQCGENRSIHLRSIFNSILLW